MPTYQYFCPGNHQTVEVMHGMTRRVDTWGELCEIAELEPGATPTDTPVEKLLGAGMVLAKKPDSAECTGPSPGGGCCGGMCRGH
ncbi:MAG: zinc ribbon domain-containing protein [Planctomycetota bacterium]